ncbi:GumB protein [Xylella fastidiosa subsp. multiplex Griffin-1]|nr:GumB protein [Xylella fastidiosa subsp. multiplex Griffin-1]
MQNVFGKLFRFFIRFYLHRDDMGSHYSIFPYKRFMSSRMKLTGRFNSIMSLSLMCAVTLMACNTAPHSLASSLPVPDALLFPQVQPEYKVAPGDLLLIKVFQVDDLERQVRVDNTGRITLPLLGSIEVSNKGAAELETLIANRYRSDYLQDPQVSIFIQEANARRVTVTGAVTEPGTYPLIGSNLTLQQVIAQAKGINTLASLQNVVVFRTVKGQKMLARFDLARIERGKDPDPEIYPGDLVVVYRSDMRLFLRTLVEITPFVMVWRAYR